MVTVSFIVSAFARPRSLELCLASLHCQTFQDFDLLVTDNAVDEEISQHHWMLTLRHVNDRYTRTKLRDCYESANWGAAAAQGEYLCFPSDDGIYFPLFLELMLERGRGADLIYCDQVWAGPSKHGGMECNVLDVQPVTGKIDKGGFLVRREVFQRLGGFSAPFFHTADGEFIERVIKSGASHRKVGIVGWVHN